MSQRRLSRRNSTNKITIKHTDKGTHYDAANDPHMMPPKPVSVFRNNRSRLSSNKFTGIESELDRLHRESDFRRSSELQEF